MLLRLCLMTLLVTTCVSEIVAQSTAPARNEKSHVERFSTPEVRAEKAEQDANTKLTANPNDDRALNSRALARVRIGKNEEAYQDLVKATKIKPDSSEYQANLGYVLWKIGRLEEAVRAERLALKLDPANTVAHYQLGRFLIRLGNRHDLNEAIGELKRALELDPRQFEARFELIAAYRELGNLAEAAAQVDVLQDSRPTDPRVFYVTALLDTDRNDLSAAVRNFNEAITRDPSMYGAYQDLGLAYAKANKWDEAARTFAELASKQPNSIEAAYFHALALYNANQSAAAEAEVRRALRIDAGAVEAHTLLGIILASKGDANIEAAESLSQAIALNPNSFDAQFYLGRVQYALRDYPNSVKSLRAAVKLNPRHGEARFFLGTVLELTGDSSSAMNEYQELLRIEPDSVMGQLGSGALLVKQGKIDDALVALNRAVSLDPNEFEAHWALGRALALKERYAEAAASFEKAVTLAPTRAEAHYQLGLAYKRLGRDVDANREFVEVEKLNTAFRSGSNPR